MFLLIGLTKGPAKKQNSSASPAQLQSIIEVWLESYLRSVKMENSMSTIYNLTESMFSIAFLTTGRRYISFIRSFITFFNYFSICVEF